MDGGGYGDSTRYLADRLEQGEWPREDQAVATNPESASEQPAAEARPENDQVEEEPDESPEPEHDVLGLEVLPPEWFERGAKT